MSLAQNNISDFMESHIWTVLPSMCIACASFDKL